MAQGTSALTPALRAERKVSIADTYSSSSLTLSSFSSLNSSDAGDSTHAPYFFSAVIIPVACMRMMQ